MYPNRCDVCSCEITSDIMWQSHIQGKNHLKKAHMLRRPGVPLKVSCVSSSASSASVQLHSANSHMTRGSLQQHELVYPVPTNMSSLANDHVRGEYSCTVCKTQVQFLDKWKSHLSSKGHRTKIELEQKRMLTFQQNLALYRKEKRPEDDKSIRKAIKEIDHITRIIEQNSSWKQEIMLEEEAETDLVIRHPYGTELKTKSLADASDLERVNDGKILQGRREIKPEMLRRWPSIEDNTRVLPNGPFVLVPKPRPLPVTETIASIQRRESSLKVGTACPWRPRPRELEVELPFA